MGVPCGEERILSRLRVRQFEPLKVEGSLCVVQISNCKRFDNLTTDEWKMNEPAAGSTTAYAVSDPFKTPPAQH